MGLIRIVRGLFGGAGGGDDDDPPTATGDEPKQGGHGDHWAAVVASEGEIQRTVMETIERGDPVEGVPVGGRKITGYLHGPTPARTCAVTADGELWTAYPAFEGIVHEVVVEDVVEWANGTEAQLRLGLGPASVGAFDTHYFSHEGYETGERYDLSLAAVAYSLWEAEDEPIETEDGEELSMAGMAGLFPFERGDFDDFTFQTTVEAVERVRVDGRTIYRLRVPLFRVEDGDGAYRDVETSLYAAEGVLDGYEPAVGDDVTGVIWLQGRRV